MGDLHELEQKAEELKERLDAVAAEIKEVRARGVDVTGECEPTILEEDGTIRLALVHCGEVIIRSGMGQAMSLTSWATHNGYRMEAGRKALRGRYFKVFKKCC